MARHSRLIVPGCVHHVVAKGVEGRNIFSAECNQQRYLERLASIAEEEHVGIAAYCLMSNHVHLLLIPETPEGLARLLRRLHTWWACLFNRTHKREGHLFKNRFYSSPMSESHFWNSLKYVEMNPNRANLVLDPEEFVWSSARAHIHGSQCGPVRLQQAPARASLAPCDYKAFLMAGEDPGFRRLLRLARAGSRPVGPPEFITGLEHRFNRRLVWKPRRSGVEGSLAAG